MNRAVVVYILRVLIFSALLYLLVANVLLVLSFIAVGLVMPPLFAISGCPAICSTYPSSSISITFTGIVNGGCSRCSTLNTTYVITNPGTPSSCCSVVGGGPDPGCFGVDSHNSSVDICFQNSGGLLKIDVVNETTTTQPGCFCCQINIPNANGQFDFTTGTSVAADCSVSGTYNLTFTSQGSALCCDYSGASVTVVI